MCDYCYFHTWSQRICEIAFELFIFKGVCVYKLYAVFIVIEEIKKNLNSVFFNFRESQQKQDAFYKQ